MSLDLNELVTQFMAGASNKLDLRRLQSELLTEYPSQVYDTKTIVDLLQKHVPDDLQTMETLCASQPDVFKTHLNLAFIQKLTSEILYRQNKEDFECVQKAVWQGISDLSSNYANTPEYGNPASLEKLTALRMDLRKAHCHYECSKVDHMITLELTRQEPRKDQYAINSVTTKNYQIRHADPRQPMYLVFDPTVKIYTLSASDIRGENSQTVPGFQIDPQDPKSVTTGFWSNCHGRASHSSVFFKRDPAGYLILDFASTLGAFSFTGHLHRASNGRVSFLRMERDGWYHVISREEVGKDNFLEI
ncbi:MAG: hypothetical protein Q9167_000935 [Letrouitia subvulpina]